MRQAHVFFPCEDLQLEGIIQFPAGSGPFPAVTVCHPHPLYGGDMDNSVVTTICNALEKIGIATLRFNFRGVGRSTGGFGQGIGEQEDAKAAINYLSALELIDSNRIGMAGYSFGSLVGLTAAATDKRIKAVAAVSPPINMANLSELLGCDKPKFFVIGQNDDFTVPGKLAFFVGQLPEPKLFEIIPEADHFWFGHEYLLTPKTNNFFAKYLENKD